jgi:hypothetical protein
VSRCPNCVIKPRAAEIVDERHVQFYTAPPLSRATTRRTVSQTYRPRSIARRNPLCTQRQLWT